MVPRTQWLRNACRRPYPRLGLVVVFVCTCVCVPLRAQDQGPKEVRAQVVQALSAGAYEDAILGIQQWIEWFGKSKKRGKILELERWYFNLGLCFYLTGQFKDSEKAFDNYLKKYREGPHAPEAEIYTADGYRFTERIKQAVRAYEKVLKKYPLSADWRTDVLCSLARCELANDDWEKAVPRLKKIYEVAPDDQRASWAATLLAIGHLKNLNIDPILSLAPYLIQSGSLASRSVAFNVSAIEAGDQLFADERFREALWVYRLIYPLEVIKERSAKHLELLKEEAEDLRESGGRYRELLRAHESIGELEAEEKFLETTEAYDTELELRIARSYMEIRRYWEARTLFLDLRSEVDEELAEEVFYLAFTCSTQIEPWDRAFELGAEYMEEYPKGEYYDTVSLTMGQMYAVQKNWPKVVSVLTEALEVNPKHESVAECMFLIGYASFMQEKLKDAIHWFKRLNDEYPENDRAEEGTYWLGMSYLFDKRYKEGLRTFQDFIRRFPNSAYLEDGTFRKAVCEYGLSLFRESERSLLGFIARYQKSKLRGEAHMMLADIAGYFGELTNAVDQFQLALQYELNIELYNYCSFRCGEFLHTLNDFDRLITHFEAYIQRNREDSNIPMAIYWVGKGRWQKDERQEAMQYLLNSVATYGKDRKALGIDMILEEWVGRSTDLPEMVTKEAWRFLTGLMVKARDNGDRALALRLQRILLFRPGISERARKLILKQLLREENIEHAAASVLETIMDEAPKLNQPALALKAANTIVAEFTETDYALDARMYLAQHALTEKRYGTAEGHLNIIREVFATRPEAGQALLILGDLFFDQRKFKDADKCFKDILGVREWRGPMWPAALFGRGECARKQRRFREATAYYERIYLMYGHYRDWAVKAYLQRAVCLMQLQEKGKARETLQEMLANAELAGSEEARKARELLERL